MVAASALGKTGYETKPELDADTPWLAQLETLRIRAAQQMNMGDVVGKGLPKVVILAPARDGGTISSRYFTPEKCHTTHALTGAVCVAAACNIRGSVAAQIANPDAIDLHRVVVEHPEWTTGSPVPGRWTHCRRIASHHKCQCDDHGQTTVHRYGLCPGEGLCRYEIASR